MSTCLACWFGWACARHAVELPPPPKPAYPSPRFEAGKCLWPNCGKTLTRTDGDTQRFHWYTHTGQKPYRCSFAGCDKNFSRDYCRIQHERIHSGYKPHACRFQGCNKAFTQRGNRATHERTHTKSKPYKCRIDNCSKRFGDHGSRRVHERIHTGHKPFKCDYGGCTRCFTNGGDLTKHKRIHTGVKPFKCPFPSCARTFTQAGSLASHRRTHTGDRPFACEEMGCDARFRQKSHLVKHTKAIHTPEGQARQKKKENAMHLALKERKVVLDYGNSGSNPNQTIDLSCVGGTRAFPDFTEQLEEVFNFFECQEDHHSHYPLSCEVKRWNDIYAALRAGGETRAIAFYLVNPDSYTVDGVKGKWKYKERMDKVVEISRKTPERPFTLFFCFYPVCKFEGIEDLFPEILDDPDFPDELKKCVRCVY